MPCAPCSRCREEASNEVALCRCGVHQGRQVADPDQVAAALAMLDRAQATDVLVLAHGWNNDIGAAERLYTQLTDNLADLIPAGSAARPAVIGILWPSVRWADEDQIAGGGVSVGDDLSHADRPRSPSRSTTLTWLPASPSWRGAWTRPTAARPSSPRPASSCPTRFPRARPTRTPRPPHCDRGGRGCVRRGPGRRLRRRRRPPRGRAPGGRGPRRRPRPAGRRDQPAPGCSACPGPPWAARCSTRSPTTR